MVTKAQQTGNKRKNKPNGNDFLTLAKVKKKDIIIMELFNKLASNNTTEGGDIENKIMHRILTAKENVGLGGNKWY